MFSINPNIVRRQTEEVTDYVSNLNDWVKDIKKEESKILNNSESDLQKMNMEGTKEKSLQLKEEGNLFYKKGKLDEAISKYSQSIALESSNPLLFANRALAYLKQDKYEEARRDCTRTLELDPSYIKAYLRRAVSFAKLGLLKEAIQDYEKVLELEPKDEEAKKGLDSVKQSLNESTQSVSEDSAPPAKAKESSLFKKKKLQKSINKCTENIEQNPSDPQFPTDRASNYIKLERYEEACIDCTNALNLDPNYTKAYLRRAKAYIGLKLRKDAICDLEKVLKLEPDNKEALEETEKLKDHSDSSESKKPVAITKPMIHGTVPEEERQESESVPNKKISDEFVDPKHKNSDTAESLKEEGNALYKKGKLKEAIAKYTESIQIDPSNALLPANRAIAFIKLEKFEEARLDCTKALELDGNYIKAYLRRAAACIKLGLLTKAVQDYKKVLELDTRNKDAKRELELLEKKINESNETEQPDSNQGSQKVNTDNEESVLGTRSSSLQSPANKSSAFSLQRSEKLKEEGNSLFKKGDLKQAIAKYTQSMALDPSNAQLPANRALAYIKLKKYEAARRDLDKALKLNPNYIKAYLRRASAYKMLKMYSEATIDYEKVLELEPWNKEAQSELNHLKGSDFVTKALASTSDSSKDATSSAGSLTIKGKIVAPIEKPLHLRSQVPLARINIKKVAREEDIILHNQQKSDSKSAKNSQEKEIPTNTTLPQAPNQESASKIMKIEKEMTLEDLPPVPRTSNQFYQFWEKIKNHPSLSTKYFLSIPLNFIEKAEIESDHLYDIIELLNSDEVNADVAASYLEALTKSSSFSLNILFLDSDQRKIYHNLLNKLEHTRIDGLISTLRAEL